MELSLFVFRHTLAFLEMESNLSFSDEVASLELAEFLEVASKERTREIPR